MGSLYDDYVESQDLDELYDLAADNLWAWLCCPCDRHMFFIGVAAGTVQGFGPGLVVSTAIQIIIDELADDTRELPESVDVLRIHTLMATLWPSDE
jgi:hypothetical protein